MAQLWQIVGGVETGGILVKQGAELASAKEPERLSTGARVEELELRNERLHYRLLEGTGPSTGWISIRVTNKELAVREPPKGSEGSDGPDGSDDAEAPDDPRPGGGEGDVGGVLWDLDAFDARRKEIQQDLRWGPRPAALFPIVSEEAPAMQLMRDMTEEEFWAAPKRTDPRPNYTRKQHPVMAAKDLPGKYFGLVFPYSIEKLDAAGPEWLTEAFHAARTLPKSNRVVSSKVIPVSVDPMEGEAVGGSSIKARLEISYERNAPGLHTSLFVKLPLVPTPESERVYNGKNWWLDEPEGMFNVIAQACPFRAAKCYFWDFSPESTNFIQIWEAFDFSDEWEPKEPWVFCKPGLKVKDYMLPRDGLERYLALFRAVARFTAAFQSDRLGHRGALCYFFEGVDQTLPEAVHAREAHTKWPRTEEEKRGRQECLKSSDYLAWKDQVDKQQQGMGELMLTSGVTLIMHVAPQLFPPKLRTSSFLMKLYQEALHVQLYGAEISEYVTQIPEMFSMMHPNTQLDNALYFYTDEECTQMDAAIIDWAAMSAGPFIMALGSNLLSGAEPRMLESHFDDICRAWLDAYHAAGGGKDLDFTLFSTSLKLGMCNAVSGLFGFTRIIMNNLPPQDPKWKQFKDRWDPEINDNYVRRATIAQCNHVLESWASPRLKLYPTFKKWLNDHRGVLLQKPPPSVQEPKAPPPKKEPKQKA